MQPSLKWTGRLTERGLSKGLFQLLLVVDLSLGLRMRQIPLHVAICCRPANRREAYAIVHSALCAERRGENLPKKGEKKKT